MDEEEQHYYFSDLRRVRFSPERRCVHGRERDEEQRRQRVCGTCLARLTELEPYLRSAFRPTMDKPDIQKQALRSTSSPRTQRMTLEDMNAFLIAHAPDARDLVSPQELLYGGILPLWKYAKSESEDGVEARVLHAPELAWDKSAFKTTCRAVESLVRAIMDLEDDRKLEPRITALCRIEPDFPAKRRDRPWIRNELDCCLSRLDDAARALSTTVCCDIDYSGGAPGAVWMGAMHLTFGTKVSVMRPRLLFPDFPEEEEREDDDEEEEVASQMREWIITCACVKWGVRLAAATRESPSTANLLQVCRKIQNALSEQVLVLQINDLEGDTDPSV